MSSVIIKYNVDLLNTERNRIEQIVGMIMDELNIKEVHVNNGEWFDCNKEDYKRKDHRQTGREHRHTVLFVHFHNLLVVHILIVCILFLQFFHAFLVLFHFQVLLAHRNTLENIERQSNQFKRQREQNNPHADAARNGNQPTDKFTDPIKLYYVEGVPEDKHGNFCK